MSPFYPFDIAFVHTSVCLFASLLYFLHHLTNNRTKKATNMEKVKYHSDMGLEREEVFSSTFFVNEYASSSSKPMKRVGISGGKGSKMSLLKSRNEISFIQSLS